MKRFLQVFVASLSISLLITACSEGEKKKGAIEEMTDHAAEVAVERIKRPIDKAKEVKELENKRVKDTESTLSTDE